jgi:hypothetical protein
MIKGTTLLLNKKIMSNDEADELREEGIVEEVTALVKKWGSSLSAEGVQTGRQ